MRKSSSANLMCKWVPIKYAVVWSGSDFDRTDSVSVARWRVSRGNWKRSHIVLDGHFFITYTCDLPILFDPFIHGSFVALCLPCMPRSLPTAIWSSGLYCTIIPLLYSPTFDPQVMTVREIWIEYSSISREWFCWLGEEYRPSKYSIMYHIQLNDRD